MRLILTGHPPRFNSHTMAPEDKLMPSRAVVLRHEKVNQQRCNLKHAPFLCKLFSTWCIDIIYEHQQGEKTHEWIVYRLCVQARKMLKEKYCFIAMPHLIFL